MSDATISRTGGAQAPLAISAPGAEPLMGSEVRDWITLLKPRVLSLVVYSGVAGLLVAPGVGDMPLVLALTAILCITIAAGAAGAINMWYDRDIDAVMRRTGANPDAQHRDRAKHRMQRAGRNQQPDQAGEDDERHHPRLQQRDPVANLRGGDGERRLRRRHGVRAAVGHQRIRGSSSKVWNGGGEETRHSSVVAPAPHGLAAACSPFRKVSHIT
jgi:hypothetical protein